jgi:hypothetical protein
MASRGITKDGSSRRDEAIEGHEDAFFLYKEAFVIFVFFVLRD